MDNPLTLKSGAAYQELDLCVFALTTGRIEQDDTTAVHKDYKQSQQIVELIESGMGIEGKSYQQWMKEPVLIIIWYLS